MKDFEASAEPLQECLNATELSVQESSTRLHDLTAKKSELHKLQVLMSRKVCPSCSSAESINARRSTTFAVTHHCSYSVFIITSIILSLP